ncbi:MAG: EF-hand domain-containing protein [Chloroflexota bacterium]
MLSDFQTKKFTKHFNLRDINKNGYVELADYEQYTQNVAQLAGWTEDSPRYAHMKQVHNDVWQFFWLPADSDGDGKVTLEEHLGMMAALVARSSEPAVLESSKQHSDALFQAFDFDGDGQISADEHRMFLQAAGVKPSEANEVFVALDTDHDGCLSKDEFADHHWHFFTGDDQASPSKGFYGPLA